MRIVLKVNVCTSCCALRLNSGRKDLDSSLESMKQAWRRWLDQSWQVR